MAFASVSPAADCGPFSVCYTPSVDVVQDCPDRCCGLRSFLGLLHCQKRAAVATPALRIAVLSRFATLQRAQAAPLSSCGLRSFLGLLHSNWRASTYGLVGCGLRSFLGLLHSKPLPTSSVRTLRIAVLSRFATLHTPHRGNGIRPDAADCGPFSVCYTQWTLAFGWIAELRIAVLSRFATLSAGESESTPWLRIAVLSRFATLTVASEARRNGCCGLRSFLGLLHSSGDDDVVVGGCGLRSFLGLLHC